MANTIKVRRGTKSSMPTLAIGELGLATDSYELFVGTAAGNKPVSGFLADAAYLLNSADSRLTNARQLVAGNSITLTDGGPGGTLTIDTVQDIRTTAIPRFAGFEVYSETFAYTVVRGAGAFVEVGYTLQRARGTLESPSAIQSGDTIGYVQWMGHDGNDYAATAYVLCSATQNWTTTAHGSMLRFYTTANNSTSSIERMRIDQDGAVYVWTSMWVWRDGAMGYYAARTHADSAFSVLFLDRSRGTKSSPTAVQNGDALGGIQFRGWDGSNWGIGAFIYGYAAENFSTTAHGANIRFFTVSNGSTSYYERMRIDHDGVVYVYSTADPCLSLSGGLKIGTLTGALFASSGTVSALAATAGSQYLRRNAGDTAYEWATLAASDLPNHATRHESGGADAITGNLDANARVGVRVNSGATTYKRRRINFIPGTSISFSMSDDSANEEVDLTISVTGGGGGGAPTDATYLTWTTPDESLTEARFFNPRQTLVTNTDTSGEYKISSLIPIGSETAAYTLDTVTTLYSNLLATSTSDRLGKESHIAWAMIKGNTEAHLLAAAEAVLGTYSYAGTDTVTTPQNIVTWDSATSLFRTTATAVHTAYVQVDLGSVMSGYVFTKFRFGVYSSGSAWAEVYVSSNGSDWTRIGQGNHTTSTGAYMIVTSYQENIRYIRITFWKTSGTYAFLGAAYNSATINKIFFFKQGRLGYAYEYQTWHTVFQVDGSLPYSDNARKALISRASWGPSTTAPSWPTGVSVGLSVCVH